MYRKLIGACVGLAMMVMAGTAWAVPFTYSYTGEPFTVAGPPYNTTSDRVSGQFTVDLASNLDLLLDDFTADVMDFSFSDGHQTLSLASGAVLDALLFSTDISGVIVEWAFLVTGAEGAFISSINSLDPEFMTDLASLGDGLAENFDTPGTWTQAPEPSTALLFATGLALLAFMGWRRRPRHRTDAAA